MTQEIKTNTDETASKLAAAADAQAAKVSLFVEKVSVIGELHTVRATWANQLGELKSQAMIHRKGQKPDEDFTALIYKIEENLSQLSRDISAFVPKSIEELHKFRDQIKARFETIGSLYNDAYARESSILPDDLEVSD